MAIRIRNRSYVGGQAGAPFALPPELGGRVLGSRESTVVDGTAAQVREALTGSPTGAIPRGISLETVDDTLIVAAAKAYTRGIVCRARTTAALAANTRTGDVLQADANGALAAQDGIALAVGDLLGVFNEVTGANNGVYRVDQLGAAGAPFILRRATEFNETADVARGARVFVEEGTLWRGTNWALDAASVNPTINTTALTFVEVTGPPSGAAGGQLGGTYPNPTVTLGMAANGFVVRTAAATWTPRTIAVVAGSAAALSVADGDGVAANPTFTVDATLVSLAGLGTVADRYAFTTGVDTWAEGTITAAGRAILDDADATAQRATLGLVIGTNVQAFDATLLSLAALGTIADRVAYTTGVDTWAETPLTGAGRALIDDADATAQRATLGLVIGTNVQAFDATLLSLAALGTAADRMAYTTGVDVWAEATITAAGRAILDDVDAAAQRTTLGLAIGTNVQAWDADLDAVAGLGANGLIARTGAGTAAARTLIAGIGTTVTNGDGVAGNPTIASIDAQAARLLLAADSQLTGAGLGAATEGAHTALTIPTAQLAEARRVIRFKALLAVDSDNGADTWQARVRIGAAGAGGTLIADTGAIDIAAGNDLWIEGVIQIRTIGAGGTFQSQVLLAGEGTWPTSRTFTSAGAIDTTVDRDLKVTGTSSSASAAQQVTLRYFEAEVYDA